MFKSHTHRSQLINTHRSQLINTHRSQLINTHRSQLINTHRSQLINTHRSELIKPWDGSAGFLICKVSFAKNPVFCGAHLQKRPSQQNELWGGTDVKTPEMVRSVFEKSPICVGLLYNRNLEI